MQSRRVARSGGQGAMKEICRPARDEWVLAADHDLELKLFTDGAIQSLCLVPDEEAKLPSTVK